MYKPFNNKGFAHLGLIVVSLAVVGAASVYAVNQLQNSTMGNFLGTNRTTLDLYPSQSNDMANEDGSLVTYGDSKIWIGTGSDTQNSYLGVRFSGGSVPANANIVSAEVS